ncbi:MAG: glycoside hydrolase family 1 protein [Chloroflexi bacterium]|nr:glycoside hydrolase family 1 protein [Chloroflexota bacterium]
MAAYKFADTQLRFPQGFLWGTASSAHQYEGINDNNDWWTWEQSGRQHGDQHVYQNQTSGTACGWWEGKAEEDIHLMAGLNNNAHRLSVEWSRIEPRPGVWDQSAIDRYRQILHTMKAAGIRPMITLHHFTLPNWAAERGAWLHPRIVEDFARFTRKVAQSLGDLCETWCTINEPNVYALHGYFKAVCPPARAKLGEYYAVLLQLLHAHAAAYRVLHEIQPAAQVGIAMHLILWEPRSRTNPLDRLAFGFLRHNFNSIALEALQTGRWQPTLARPGVYPRLANTLDWVGINYYQRYEAGFRVQSRDPYNLLFAGRPNDEKGPGWWGEFWPEGLLLHLEHVHRRFGLPIYITENGVPDAKDVHRPHYILDHLLRVQTAIEHGINVGGYYHWSLVDNFEWREGYNPAFAFGLYALDQQTQSRTPRRSASLYREIAATNALRVNMAEQYAPESLTAIQAALKTARG